MSDNATNHACLPTDATRTRRDRRARQRSFIREQEFEQIRQRITSDKDVKKGNQSSTDDVQNGNRSSIVSTSSSSTSNSGGNISHNQTNGNSIEESKYSSLSSLSDIEPPCESTSVSPLKLVNGNGN